MTSTSFAHQRLRFATRDAHEALERALDAIGQLCTLDGRRGLAPRFLRLHTFADAVFDRWLAGRFGLDAFPRRRAEFVRADLQVLGIEPPSPDPAAPAPVISGVPEALGFFYVVEGSTLGGRMILRQLAERGADPAGLSFMDPYGPRTGEAWRGFLDVLEREVANDPARLDAAEAGARNGFAYAHACLCGPA